MRPSERISTGLVGLVLTSALASPRPTFAWDCREEPSPGRLLLPPKKTVPPDGALFLTGSTESVGDIVKTYKLAEPNGRQIRFTAECWPFARWKIEEIAKDDRSPGFQYDWRGRRTRICRLTPTKPLKPGAEYGLTGVEDTEAPASTGADAKTKRTVVRFRTTVAGVTKPPDASGPATATPFFFRVNAPGFEMDGKPVDGDARGIVLKMRLPRYEGGAPALFAVWFGKAEGPANWIVGGSNGMIVRSETGRS